MRALPYPLLLCLALPVVGQTPASESGLRKIVKVEAQTKVIEEASLNLESPLATSGKAMPDIGANNSSKTIPTSSASGGSDGAPKAIPSTWSARGMGDMAEEAPAAATFYEFTLDAKGELTVHLKAKESGRIYMRFVNPLKTGAMTGPVKRANLPHKSSRMQRIQISNPTSEPQVVTLALLGTQNVPYRMDIERKN